jgi:curved DNA-binding protein CbpA
LAFLLFAPSSALAHEEPPKDQNITAPYDWEDWNYYHILGLESNDDSSAVTPAEIRKAYRQNAKRYHPDKLIEHGNITIEESNARFNRIAEAYQVLHHEEQRKQYDAYLQRQKQKQQESSDERQQRASWEYPSWDHDWGSLDPRSLFEDFFASFWPDEDETEEDTYDPHYVENPFRERPSLFAGEHFRAGSGGRPSTRARSVGPDAVTEQRQVWIDPVTGRDIMRIYTTEEYAAGQEEDGTVYVRVLSQDFVDDWDPWSGRWVYRPLQDQPSVVEEGYYYREESRARRSDHLRGENLGSSPFSESSPSNAVLLPGMVLSSTERLVNRRYVAGISDSCLLYIARRGSDRDLPLVWSSEEDTSHYHGYSCQLQLHGSQLVLTAHGYSRDQMIVWTSDPSDEDDFAFASSTVGSSYVASLDEDGSLAVYRIEPVHPLWVRAWKLPRLPLLQAWRHMLLTVGAVRLDLGSYSPARLVCVSATGPVGCFRLGRWFVQVVRDAAFLVRWVISVLDHFLEEMM